MVTFNDEIIHSWGAYCNAIRREEGEGAHEIIRDLIAYNNADTYSMASESMRQTLAKKEFSADGLEALKMLEQTMTQAHIKEVTPRTQLQKLRDEALSMSLYEFEDKLDNIQAHTNGSSKYYSAEGKFVLFD